MRLSNLAVSLICVATGCASLGGAIVAFKSPGSELGRIDVAAPVLIVESAIWLVSAWRVHAIRLTVGDVLFFLCVLAAGLILSLSSGHNFPGGDYFHINRGFPWYWLRLWQESGGPATYGSVDSLGALGDGVFWAGVSLIVLWLAIVATNRQSAAAEIKAEGLKTGPVSPIP